MCYFEYNDFSYTLYFKNYEINPTAYFKQDHKLENNKQHCFDFDI